MTSPDAPPPRRTGADRLAANPPHAGRTGTSVATTSRSIGDVGRYCEGRERVLGRRAWLPIDDPQAGFDALCEALGGRRIGGAYVQQMAREAGYAWPVDHEGQRIDYTAFVLGYGGRP